MTKNVLFILGHYSQVCYCSCCHYIPRRCYRRMFYLNLSLYRRYLFTIFLLSIFIYYKLLNQTETSDAINQTSDSIRILYLIRTAGHFYKIRLIHLLQTWISLVKDDAFFTSDVLLPNISNDHLILTKETCGSEAHSMNVLCCKTAHDFIIFHHYFSKYDWFCHFDDDQYVNVNNLRQYLSKLDSTLPYYIGRASWNDTIKRFKEPFPYPFWFATLGAGVCLSKRSISLLKPYTQNVSQFVDGCIKENYHDDIYLGFLLNGYLNISLTKNKNFHSHLEKSFYYDKHTFLKIFTNEITFGFSRPHRFPYFLPQLYESNIDPFRIRSLHCLLNAQLKECESKLHQYLFNSTK